MSGSFVVAVGPGVVILLVVWITVVVAWVQLSDEHASLRSIVTALSILITLTLVLIPTNDGDGKESFVVNPDTVPSIDLFEIYDYNFILKGILMFVMSVGVVAALWTYTTEFWSVKIHGSAPVQTAKTASDLQGWDN